MVQKRSAHIAGQFLAGRQANSELAKGERHGSFACAVAVAEAPVVEIQRDIEAAHQFVALIAIGSQPDIKASEMSFDATHASQQFGQSAKLRIACAQRNLELC